MYIRNLKYLETVNTFRAIVRVLTATIQPLRPAHASSGRLITPSNTAWKAWQ